MPVVAKSWKLALLAALLAAAGLLLWFHGTPAPADRQQFQNRLAAIVEDYRRILVLMDGTDGGRRLAVARALFHRKLDTIAQARADLNAPGRAQWLIDYFTASSLHDGDRLALAGLLEELDTAAAAPAREQLRQIQTAYREEVSRLMGPLMRGEQPRREKWEDYMRGLRSRLPVDRILEEFPDIQEPESAMRGQDREIFGHNLPANTVVLTFDDGPHPRYTEQVMVLLAKYGLRAGFFQIGKYLGSLEDGNAKLTKLAALNKRIAAAGHTLGNHGYSHSILTRISEEAREREIGWTNSLLEASTGLRPELFRAPFGARNKSLLDAVAAHRMQSVMWTIDSLDWADPIPESIAARTLKLLAGKKKGIILFHDVHRQSILAVQQVLEELVRQQYAFQRFDGAKLVDSPPGVYAIRAPVAASLQQASAPVKPLYRESWAVIIGINDYRNWPRLRHAVRDADAVEQALVSKFGFRPENVRKLTDREATRERIMALLGDELSDPDKVHREDRLFFFFAGHGATRKQHDGRETGFLIPADAGRNNFFSTAIPMNALRDAAELIPAKHVYFVMDACYGGLALTRAGGAFSRNRTYLEEISRRTARQILTAGGADQQVTDEGPGGHSVFTWALLQGLEGQADLDANGVITASELGAYVSPVVSSFSRQTPAMGNLAGSEGGEFLFELRPEPLTMLSSQLEGRALEMTEQLARLQRQIEAKQAELLALQRSIQSESARLEGRAAPPVKPAGTSAYDLDRQGRQYYRERKYDLAIASFREAVNRKPNDPVLMNNLGYALYRAGQLDAALDWLLKTVKADPKRKEVHGNLGDTYAKLGRNAEARTHYQQYLALYPSSPQAAKIRRAMEELDGL
ncbi:MAG: tetratricopeptide repeat protein [Acidimicrobiia bacterium]|nr:tetratricopeptide repeat protein [Acidimicrobiia bacterium]